MLALIMGLTLSISTFAEVGKILSFKGAHDSVITRAGTKHTAVVDFLLEEGDEIDSVNGLKTLITAISYKTERIIAEQ